MLAVLGLYFIVTVAPTSSSCFLIASASAFSNLTTVVSVLIGIFVMAEPFSLMQIIGAIIIIIGVFGVNYYGNDS